MIRKFVGHCSVLAILVLGSLAISAEVLSQSPKFNAGNGVEGLVSLTALTPPVPASDLEVMVTGPTSINFTWSDNSDDEWGFRVYRKTGITGSWSYLGAVRTNSTGVSLTDHAAGTYYELAVAAYNGLGWYNPPITSVTLPGISSREYHPATVGEPFSYEITASSDGGAPDGFDFSGALPTGLEYEILTHRITGTPTEAGVFSSTLSVHYPAWGDFLKTFTLRVIHPAGSPRVTTAIPQQTVPAGGTAVTLPLNDFFADPDTEKAVRFTTSLGSFDVALYATATPSTVTNFLGYVNQGHFSDTLIHRAAPNFVVQGSGFVTAPPDFAKRPTYPSPPNEPGISNLRGTMAMAKVGGNPNSATDQWFVSLNDNAANLDNQNGGFTAFGRVCGNGMTVIDAIDSLPRGNYTISIDGESVAFENWPMDAPPPAPAAMDQSKLVLVHSISVIEPLTYQVISNAAPGLVTSSINGAELVLTPASSFGGRTEIGLVATDRDGNSIAQTVTVELTSPYTTWLNQYPLDLAETTPGADPEEDLVSNAAEFALMGSPVVSDANTVMPAGSMVQSLSQPYAALTFRLRKELGGARVVIESTTGLAGESWIPVWNSTLAGSFLVMQQLDLSDHWLMTVRDSAAVSPGSSQRFLRLQVIVPQ